jgi:hypothetical protein
MPLFALTHHNGIRLAEVGFALAAIAGGILALAPAGRRAGNFLAGVALAIGSVLLIVAVHWGHVG